MKLNSRISIENHPIPAKDSTIYANSTQIVIPKPSQHPASSPNTVTNSTADLYPTKHPESSNNSSSYDSSTQKSVKTAEIGKMTVKYTNISRTPSHIENDASGHQKIQTQTSISSTGSIRRPSNIPNLQKSKFYDNINQKLQVITPRDVKSFDFPGPKSPLNAGHGQKVSKGTAAVTQSKSQRSAGKSPIYVDMNRTAFNFDGVGQMSSNLSFPDVIQNSSKTGTLKPTTAFSLNLGGTESQKSPSKKGTKSPVDENAPKLPKRPSQNLPQNRESIDVDYCEPLVESSDHQVYSEPYIPSKK
jgi:hypothetical protein